MRAVVEALLAAGEAGSGESWTDAQIGAFLFAFGRRPPTAAELSGAAGAMRERMLALPLSRELRALPLLDTCGTGGSGLSSFNTSTLVAVVAAAGGCHVVKHGNRASTSACGSADLLEAWGIRIDLPPADAARSLEETGFCFCFAPLYHPATKRVQVIRRELGFRTLFNFLGPLCNPARTGYQVLGVSSPELLPAVAEALLSLGVRRAAVVCGSDGLDEVTLSGKTDAFWLEDGKMRELRIEPADLGLPRYPLSSLLGGDREANLKAANAVLSGERGPLYDLVLANAGVAFAVAGKAASIREGVTLADELLQNGSAARKRHQISGWKPL
jgi:anthranilate phosphoribosyltransferase